MAVIPLCHQCGTCCRKGGPALHEEDLGFVEAYGLNALVCLRKGEPAHDPQADAVQPLLQEVVKILGKDQGWECIFYDPAQSGCTIYNDRPLECRVLSCKNSHPLFEAMKRPYLQRKDFIQQGSALWACIQSHEQEFPVNNVLPLATRSRQEKQNIPKELDQIFRAEIAYRLALGDYVQAKDEDLWPYLGRPLWLVLAPYDSRFLEYGKI